MTVMTNEEKWVKLRDNFEVFTKTWYPPKEITTIATLTFVHGLGEHIARYEHVFLAFQKAGIQVHAWDQRGFGQTGKKYNALGKYGSRDLIMDDVKEAILRNTIQGKPRFLAGHSMGGLIVLDFVCTQDIHLDGVMATAPALGIPRASQPPKLKRVLGSYASYFFPFVTIDNELNLKGLASDPKVAQEYVRDVLVHTKISLQLASYLLDRGLNLLSKKRKHNLPLSSFHPSLPIFLSHGEADPITDAQVTYQFYQAMENKDKTFKLYKGYLHELHNEPDIQVQYIHTLVQWILDRCGSK